MAIEMKRHDFRAISLDQQETSCQAMLHMRPPHLGAQKSRP